MNVSEQGTWCIYIRYSSYSTEISITGNGVVFIVQCPATVIGYTARADTGRRRLAIAEHYGCCRVRKRRWRSPVAVSSCHMTQPPLSERDLLYTVARRVLFELDPERAHDLALGALQRLAPGDWLRRRYTANSDPRRVPSQGRPPLRVSHNVFGIDFPNRVGLAAGLDKNGDYLDALGALGFGCLEIGTVTPKPQPGNPRPRLFRLASERALINRMGFNNHGVEHLARRVEQRRYTGRLGINIGKNASTPLTQAADDYRLCLERVYPLADYVTINVSSPNTQGLRDLQHGEHLRSLLENLKNSQARLHARHGMLTPLLVKIAPDLDEAELDTFCKAAVEHELDGVIAGNTTSTRTPVKHHLYAREAGGLSGAPLKPLADRQLRRTCERLNGKCPVIGVGGIDSGEDAAEKIRLGADMVQLYSGLIFHGPALVRDCVERMQHVDDSFRSTPSRHE